MTFSDQDAIEEMMGKRVQMMTADELVTYYKTYVEAVHEVKLPVGNQHRERSVFQGLKNQYGPDAGLIVKWVCWKYQAQWKQRNGRMKIISYFGFQKSYKWWTDDMYLELQAELKVEKPPKKQRKSRSSSFSQLGDL